MLHQNQSSDLDIAIVGMAGRFPGAPDVETFWQNIRNGIESVHHYSDQELRELGVDEALIRDPDYVKAGIPFEGKDLFDAEFFGYTPRDAAQMDPQQRLLLECAWHALEHAGHARQPDKVRIGVYAGAGTSYYLLRHLMPRQPLDQRMGITELLALMGGNGADSLATRIAYKLGLRGPAITVQTACSTSLTAVHMACQALLGHECDMALAGGVSLNLIQKGGYRYQQGAILSPDGHCRAFDARAGGTLVGSGVALVVLKRLEDALRDDDTIHAVIKGSSANNDGADKVGYTAPSIRGQAAVIRAAQAMADVSPDSIGLIEAHGTGTTLGDPIEIAALTEAFRQGTDRNGFCAIGSVKTNVGHLDAAAGVTGLIKAALSVRDGVLPASINFESPNPKIDFDNSPFRVNTETRPWLSSPWPRRAGVSSFGIGGTNVHVVLEEPPSIRRGRNEQGSPENLHGEDTPDPQPQLLMLSARHEAALADSTRELAAWLRAHPEAFLPSVARSLRVGRASFRHRQAVIAGTVDEAVRALRVRNSGLSVAGEALEAPSVAFMFPGQGAQHPGMARSLYEQEDVFRQTVDRCCRLLAPELGLDLRSLLFADDGHEDVADRLAQTALTQPALFVIEYAMAQWWVAQGICPDAMIGHSVGEYAAACMAGVFSLEDALRLIAARGRLLQATRAGAMLAVSLAESALKQAMPDGCDLAAVNAPDLCVLAGTLAAIEQAEQKFSSGGVGVRRLMVSRAFHSSLVEPVLAEFETLLKQVKLSPPSIPFISNLSGHWITADEACSPAYWCQHVRGTVRFEDGLNALLEKPGRILLEVGPGDTLTSLARRHPALGQRTVMSSQCHPQRAMQNALQPLRCLAQMWTQGVNVEDAAMLQHADAHRMPLPGYPFHRQSYWIEAVESRAGSSRSQARSRCVTAQGQTEPSDWLYQPVWQRALPVREPQEVEPPCGPILLLGEDDALTETFVERATVLGHPVIKVMPANDFERHGTNVYQMMPGSRQQMQQLWHAVELDHGRPTQIIHLWCLNKTGETTESAPVDRGFHTLLALVQAIDERQAAGETWPLSITIVANGIEDVTGTEVLCPQKATLHGIRLVVPQELPNIRCALVDVVHPDSMAGVSRITQQVMAEIRAGLPDSLVAYRGAHRWLKSYQNLPARQPGSSPLREKGVYLITGGFGGIGLVIACHLAEKYQARLVLIGRSPIDEGRQAAIRALEAMGGEVLAMQGDVSESHWMNAVIKATKERFGDLHGVLHTAGVLGSGMIGTRHRKGVDKVFLPKLAGSLSLIQALNEGSCTPDFVVLFSSLASVLGGLGKIDYAAANACLDSLAAAASVEQPYPVSAINWDGWREVGMAAYMKLPDDIGVRPDQGLKVLETVLAVQRPSQIIVSTTPLGKRLEAKEGELLQQIDNVETEKLRAERHLRPLLSVSYQAPETELELDIQGVWGEFLGIEGIGIDDNLFELGGDSLLAIQLLARVRNQYGVELHPAAFLKSPTIRLLAEQVESRLIEEIETETS
ncbi:MAG: SDR family NAD(P)-dependent oxidoreductase [Lautropia sp.]|nr:SDR family NAD(P)-dependent oxidoreductase [Lautropia sp.]